LKVEISFKTGQLWGYDYYSEKDALVLKLRNPPVINPKNPLLGLIIAIDPGHGGDEKGAVGPTNIPEKDINLTISKFLKQELENFGAKVIMTRAEDVFTDLYERPETAKQNNAVILLSIHNNSLPAGKDPYTEHGTSTYYYHLQSADLAASIKDRLIKDLNLNDLGVFKRSFVLTRPFEQLSVLIEVAFMINPDEYTCLLNPEFQKQSASAIRKGIEEFLLNNLLQQQTTSY